ncbi:MAG: AI-2E family transporter [archaeon]|jgi:predicted PurR-regulated permease PerM|nr:AI-2E family transporter [archaeon]
MELNDKMIREVSAIVVLVLLGVLVFFALKPIIFAVLWALILAYMFMPLLRILNKTIKSRTLCAIIVLIIATLIILVPLWFVIPMISQQVFEIFRASQSLDVGAFLSHFFPTASEQFVAQTSAALGSIVTKLTSSVMSGLSNFILNIPLLLINLFVVGFVFFFTLRDHEKIKEFVKGISPLSKVKERIVVKQFEDITYSIIYGNVVVGIAQGLLAALGFFIFGVQNALVLSILAIFAAIIPIAGAFLVWIPVAVYMFAMGNTGMAVAFVLYNAVIVSNIDNVLLAYIVSRRTILSPVFALISAIGGLYLFGIIGLILGPLIFAYFMILLDLYKEKNLLNLFSKEEPEDKKSESK